MLKKSLSFMVVGGLLATSSYAFHPFQQLQTAKHKNALTAAPKKQASATQKYTDFSGIWTGTCSGEGEGSEPETVTIKNDDMTIRFDNEYFMIGGNLKTDSYSNPWSTAFSHLSLYWNEDKTQLIGSSAFVHKYHNDSGSFTEEFPVSTSIATMVMSLKNDQLIIEGNAKSYSGLEKDDQVGMTCTYTRTQY